MAFSRKQMAAAVAGTLSLAMLTGCPAAAPTGTGTPTPTPPASMAPSTAPSTGASVDPGASVAPSTAPSTATSTDPNASPVPTSSAPAPSGRTVIVSGNVYDEEGATVDGALITVKSLDASVPYTATATSQAGSWVVNNVPEGANVEIVATREGWTQRRRVGSFQQQATGRRNIINFGAAGGNADNDDEDPTGEAYFISDYPEIVSTTPVDESKDADATKVEVKLTFSEPLTEDSRENFEEVFTILPASDEAVGDDDFSGIDIENEGEDNNEDDGVTTGDFDLSNFEYSLQEGDAFLGSSNTKMRATWNSEGTEVTFSFGGALLADDNETAKYQMALIVDNTSDEIEDEDGNQLGTDEEGDLDSYEAAGELIYNAFKEPDLSIDNSSSPNNSGEGNWAFTHDTAVNFEVREDETTPKLTAVDVTEEGNDQRIELTFSEPMAAYGGTATGIFGDGIFDLTNYTFAVGEDRGDLDDVDLEGEDEGAESADTGSAAMIEDVTNIDFDDEFYLDSTPTGAILGTDQASDISDFTNNGDVFIQINEDDPRVLYIWIANRGEFFDNVNEIKARVEGVEDPAGNEINERDADANVVTGSI